MIPIWLLGPAAATAVGVVAFLFVYRKHERAGILLMVASGVPMLRALLGEAQRFTGFNIAIYNSLFNVVGLGLLVYGIFELIDARHPTRGITLPAAVQQYRTIDMLMHVPEILIGVFAIALMALSGMREPTYWLPAVSAIVAALVGSALLRRRNSVLCFVLERVPENVVWVYVQQVFVVNRGTRSWSVCVGLSTGGFVMQPTRGEAAAKELVSAIAAVCPDATFGYDGEKLAKFRANPSALRAKP